MSGYDKEGKKYIDIQSKEEAIEFLEKRRSIKPVEAYAILPPDYKRDKDVIITAMRTKAGKKIYEELVPEDCKNDIDIAGIYLEFLSYDYNKIPIEIKEKLQNPVEIQEAILKYPGIAMACMDHGDVSKIPDELIANPQFIRNITIQPYISSRAREGFSKFMSKSEKRYRKIKDRIPRDNIEKMVEIYKTFPNDVVFKDTELEENAEFIISIAELLVQGIEMPNHSTVRKDGVIEFASNKLLSNPEFMSEAINRDVDGFKLYNGKLYLYDFKRSHQCIKECLKDQYYLFNVAMGIDIEKVDIERLPIELQVIIRSRPEFIEYMEKIKEQQEKSEKLKNRILETSIKDLNLSTRSLNGLRRANVNILRDLLHRTKQDLLKFRYLGNNSINEIISKLEEYGIVFNEDGKLELGDIGGIIETEDLKSEELKNRILETSIKDLNLSARSLNGLERANINILQDLLHRTKRDLLKFRNLGNNSINEIISKLEEYGFVFNEDGELELGDIRGTIEAEDLQDEIETRNSLGEQLTPEDKKTEELDGMTVKELQQIVDNNSQTIKDNDVTIKKALVERIIAQQKTIFEQQLEINRLNSQKKEL